MTEHEFIFPVLSVTEPLDLNRMFPRAQPLEIELGSGDGSFLAQYAAANPGRNFIGVERLLGRLRKLERKARRLGLSNLQAIRIEAAYFLAYLLPARCAEAIHVYFPDPWPKRKHRRHRLINQSFPERARAALVPGGLVFLRTDDVDYFTQMKSVFATADFFEEIVTPDALAGIKTDFERGFLARGVSTLSVGYRLLRR